MNILLPGKTNIPLRSPSLIKRERLLKRLDQALDYPLTLVSASAGYGKTTLVSDWVHTLDTPCCWYAIDTFDNAPRQFLKYLIASLQPVLPDAAVDLWDMLEQRQLEDLQDVFVLWIRAAAEYKKELILVLDDYHLISNLNIHQQLAFIVEHIPENLHVLVLSREDPPIPLGRLRAKRQLLEIRNADLQFNPGEGKQLLSVLLKSPLDLETEQHLFEKTEGWVTGLQLAALSIGENPQSLAGIETFHGGSHFVLDYLVEEVLANLSDEKRDFLVKTAFLTRLNPDLCNFVLDRNDSKPLLESFYHQNLFLIAQDSDLAWFRYHHLFADLLIAHGGVNHSTGLAERQKRAALWFYQNNDLEMAMVYATQAQAWDQMGIWVGQHGLERLYHGEIGVLQQWLSVLPTTFIHEDAWLLTLETWVALLSGQPEKCQRNLSEIEKLLTALSSNSERMKGLGHTHAILAYLYAFQRNIKLSDNHAQLALKYIPPEMEGIRAVVAFTKAANAMLGGDVPLAAEFFEKAGNWGRTENIHIAVPALGSLGSIYLYQGNLVEAKKCFEKILVWTRRSDGSLSPLASRGLNGLVEISLEKGESEKALDFAEKSVNLAEKWRIPDVVASAALHQIAVYVSVGDLAKAQEKLSDCQDLLLNAEVSPGIEEIFQELTIEFQLSQGNLTQAVQLALKTNDRLALPIQLTQVNLWLVCMQCFLYRSDLYQRAGEMAAQLKIFAQKQGLNKIILQSQLVE